jgi:hypothetical protein
MKISTDSIQQSKRWAVILFISGVALALAFWLLPDGREAISHLAGWGYGGILLAGILYSFAFTSGLATLVLANHTGLVNPIYAAVLAGAGSLLYDLFVFTVIRRNIQMSTLEKFKLKFSSRRRLFHWLMNIVGVLILASPLPDELAAGVLSLSGMRQKLFLTISFVANTIGILIILLST